MEYFLQNYQELVGAIVGGVIGIIGSIAILVITHMFQHGTISVNLCKWEIKFLERDNYGDLININTIKEAERAEYKIELDFYNSSDYIKSIRNIEIEFKQNKKTITNNPFYQKGYIGAIPLSEYVTVLNIFPKQFLHVSMGGVIQKEGLDIFRQNSTVFFNANFPKGKKFRTKISDITVSDI
jgi:hypothetical protein